MRMRVQMVAKQSCSVKVESRKCCLELRKNIARELSEQTEIREAGRVVPAPPNMEGVNAKKQIHFTRKLLPCHEP